MNGDMFPELSRIDDPNRRYTGVFFMEWIKTKANVTAFDLDPAADAESHWAPRWFSLKHEPGTAGVNGLEQSWLPPDERAERWRIFINPPFDDLAPWLERTWETVGRLFARDVFVEFTIAFVLPGNRHEQPFWQEHVEPFRDGRWVKRGARLDCYFPPGRQAYAKPGSGGVVVGSADFPSAVLVWRRS